MRQQHQRHHQRHRITDSQWTFLQPFIPKSKATTGRPPADPRMIIDGLMWILRTGAPWRDLPPEQFGPWQTVYHYRNAWRDDGTLDKILLSLQVRLDRSGKIDWDLWCIDGSVVRAARCAAGAAKISVLIHDGEPPDHALGRSRGGFTSKFHLITDANGLPLAIEVSAGQQHDSTMFEAAMEAVVGIPQHIGRPRRRPKRLAGDKGYSYQRIRDWLRARGIGAVIAQRDDQRANHKGRPIEFDKDAYRRRSIIEQCIGWLKECRRVLTRYEKLAINFVAMIKLAMLQRYLRLEFSDRA
jgi:transposase